MTRDELRNKAIKLSRKYPYLILQWATGTGKSSAAIAIQEAFKAQSTLLTVAEIAHLNNWEEQYLKHGIEESLDSTEMFCYASLGKYVEREVDLLILDEGHHSTTDIRMDYLSTIKAKRIVVLTATIDRDKIAALNDLFGVKFHVDKIDLDMAIRERLLPEPKIYVVPLELDDLMQSETVEFTRGKKDKRVHFTVDYKDRWTYMSAKTKYPDLHLTIKTTQKQKYDHITDQYEYYRKRSFIEYLRNKFLYLGSERKRFLGELKTPFIRALLKRLEGKRYICFTASVNQAKELGGINAIHSKRPDSLEVIDQFNQKKIDNIFAVGMLQEGQNLEDIEVGIIGQLDGQDRAFIQKLGRTLRAENPVQVIFYFKNTRDEEYLRIALENINPDYVIEVEDITKIPL